MASLATVRCVEWGAWRKPRVSLCRARRPTRARGGAREARKKGPRTLRVRAGGGGVGRPLPGRLFRCGDVRVPVPRRPRAARRSVAREAARVLKPGGVFILADSIGSATARAWTRTSGGSATSTSRITGRGSARTPWSCSASDDAAWSRGRRSCAAGRRCFPFVNRCEISNARSRMPTAFLSRGDVSPPLISGVSGRRRGTRLLPRSARQSRRAKHAVVYVAPSSPHAGLHPNAGRSTIPLSPRGAQPRRRFRERCPLARAPAGTRRLGSAFCVCAGQKRRAPRPARVRVRHRVADASAGSQSSSWRSRGREEFVRRPRGRRARCGEDAARRSGVRLEVGVRDDDEREREDARDTEYACETHGLGTPSEVRRRFEGTVSPSRVKTFRRSVRAPPRRATENGQTAMVRPVASPSPPRSASFTRRRIPTRPGLRRGVRLAPARSIRGHHRQDVRQASITPTGLLAVHHPDG